MKKVIYFFIVSLLVLTSCKKDGSNPVATDTVPSPPTLATPKDTSSNIAVPAVLTWNESSGATSYTLQVSTSSSFSSFIFNKNDITALSQQIAELNYLSVYYWRVCATNSTGTSDWSKVWSFNTTGEAGLVPQLSQPVNGAVDQKLSPILTWNRASNANSYTLQISTNSSFTSFVFDTDSLTATSKQITELSGSTKYYWRVSAANNFGTKGWSDTWSFTTGVAPIPPLLSSPSDGAINQVLSPTLTWNASTGAVSYKLQVSTNSSFTSYVYNQSGLTNTNKQITGLAHSTKYFWQVSTTNNFGTSNLSNVWSFTTGASPASPTLLTPNDGSTEISLSPTITWNPSTGATSYTLQVSTNSSFTSYVYNQSNLSSANTQLTGLINSTKYYWRVSATNNYGISNPSDVWSFTTGAPPLPPTLSSPANSITEVTVSPILLWNASSRATSYSLQVATDNSFTSSSLVVNENVGNITSKQLSALSNLKTYYWRVAAVNSYGTSPYSTVWSFATVGLTGVASISGKVTNSLSLAISGVKIYTSPATATVYSDAAGIYVINNIAGGAYTVFAEKTGYYNYSVSISLAQSQAYTQNILMTATGNVTSCVGTPTVVYVGKTYNTIQIGTQCWLRENLDIGTMIQGTVNPSNNGAIEKYCYNNNSANCNTYGGLYRWQEAMAYSTSPGTRGICPTGWHIPTKTEYETLRAAVNNDGNALKEVGQGTGSGEGTNISGFSALLAGYCYDSKNFNSLWFAAYFWNSTEYDATNASYWGLGDIGSDITSYGDSKDVGCSIRCIKD